MNVNNRSVNRKVMKSEDPLFGNRVEERFLLSKKNAEAFLERIKTEEDKSQSQWVTNTYFNTPEQSLPMETAVRTREYNLSKSPINLKNRGGFVDYSHLLNDKKIKTRKTLSTKETILDLNSRFRSRINSFDQQFIIRYFRRVFLYGDIKFSMDGHLECFEIIKGVEYRKVKSLASVYVEIKHNGEKEAERVIKILRDLGGIPTIPKYYLFYNWDYCEHAEKKYDAFLDEVPGLEYELKISCDSDRVFNNFFVDLRKEHVKGYRLLEEFPYPFTFASYNEFRKSKEPHQKVLVMYDGTKRQRFSTKNKGSVIKGQILKRSKTEGSVSQKDLGKFGDITGVSFRIKKIIFIESLNTERIFGVIIDLSQKAEGDMFQIEIEYEMSKKKISGDFEEQISKEIDEIAKYFESRGLKRTLKKKEDWIKEK